MALAAPDVEVAGLTTVGGNVPRARATRNALALLQAAGRPDIPVAPGAARPRRGRFRPSVAFHGPGGLSARLPEPAQQALRQTAVEFLREQLASDPGNVEVVALGPLTNLSLLEDQHPGLLTHAQQVMIMGGAVQTTGNVTAKAEFNFHSDPVAAAQLLGLDIPFGLVDLAACRQVGISREQAAGLRAGTPLGALALRILQGWFRHDPRRLRFEFYDPLALALALDPGVASMRQVAVSVATEPGEHWGESTVTGEHGLVSLADTVDAGRFFALVRELLGWQGL